MTDYDIFNGDADGICALHQLRLVEPRHSSLITGVKRDIRLVEKVINQVKKDDRLTVLDISVDPNLEALYFALDQGAHVTWFDHHNPGDIPTHPSLTTTINLDSQVCTSLLVDQHLHGRHRLWTIAALFGDGLPKVAKLLAEQAGLATEETKRIASLGEAINYNAYGETIDDLHISPDQLYLRLSPFHSPFDFMENDTIAHELIELMQSDMSIASQHKASYTSDGCKVFVLPDAAWARRANGVFSNTLSLNNPNHALAVVLPLASGHLQISVRAPKTNPVGADIFCRSFPTGGGRAAAAGINCLPAAAIEDFIRAFEAFFNRATSNR